MALLERTFVDLHFVSVENRICIRQSQTEPVAVVLEGPFLSSLPYLHPAPRTLVPAPAAFLSPPGDHRDSSGQGVLRIVRGQEHKEGKVMTGIGPTLGAAGDSETGGRGAAAGGPGSDGAGELIPQLAGPRPPYPCHGNVVLTSPGCGEASRSCWIETEGEASGPRERLCSELRSLPQHGGSPASLSELDHIPLGGLLFSALKWLFLNQKKILEVGLEVKNKSRGEHDEGPGQLTGREGTWRCRPQTRVR